MKFKLSTAKDKPLRVTRAPPMPFVSEAIPPSRMRSAVKTRNTRGAGYDWVIDIPEMKLRSKDPRLVVPWL